MPNLGKYEPKSPYEYQNTYYDEKTSDHGHYVPEVTGKRYGRNGDHAKVTQMRWVEDNRSFEAPDNSNDAAPVVEAPPEKDSPVYASEQSSKAQDLVNTYKTNIMNDSPYQTKIESNTPNLNTQGTNVLGAYESNTFGAPEAIEPAESKAADSFLKSKKLELGSGLNLQ